MVTKDIIRQIPKVELHEHLDGGLRPETIIDIAAKEGFPLPASTPEALREWFIEGCVRKSLVLYLKTFSVTTGVMQTKEALFRVAEEEMLDLAASHVLYAEIRFDPTLHLQKGLRAEEVIETVLLGLESGKRKTGIEYGLIICTMRHQSPAHSLEVARLAVQYMGKGVVAFDLAGGEKGNPARNHIEAFRFVQEHHLHLTIHSGEADGLESIRQSILECGAQRLGHGTRIIDDIVVENGKIVSMGELATLIHDRQIPLEMCITSNVGTGAVPSFGEHPFPILLRSGFRVSLNSDNRLMSDTSQEKETEEAAEAFDLTQEELKAISLGALESSFADEETKRRVREKMEKEFNALSR